MLYYLWFNLLYDVTCSNKPKQWFRIVQNFFTGNFLGLTLAIHSYLGGSVSEQYRAALKWVITNVLTDCSWLQRFSKSN